MQASNKLTMIRLMKESQMALKGLKDQMDANSGKIVDNFICLPDPENPFIWYFVVFGL